MDCSYPTFISYKLVVLHRTIIDFTQGSATWSQDGGGGQVKEADFRPTKPHFYSLAIKVTNRIVFEPQIEDSF